MDAGIARWNFVHSETIALLNALSDDQLLFTPEGDKWQPLYYQFACIARTQLVYARAAQEGKMDFALFGSDKLPGKHSCKTKQDLLRFLTESDRKWLDSIATATQDVVWPDGPRTIQLHMQCLAEHERIHHGQLVSYFTLAGIELPHTFRSNWAM